MNKKMIYVLPLLMPFVFFFADGVKIAGSLLVAFAFVVWFIIHLLKDDIARKKAEHIQLQKELEEQKKIEESGKL